MNGARRKAVIVLASMGGAAALAKVAVPTEKIADRWETDLDRMFPTEFGDWRIDRSIPVILPAPDVQAKLDVIYNQVIARTYVDARTGDRVMLSVAYGGDQSDGMSVHLPEVCYPAQGFAVRSRTLSTLELSSRTIPVVQLVTRLGPRVEPVTYWITVGDSVVPTRTQQKLAQIRYGFRGLIPDGMLVRVSSIDPNETRAFGRHRDFVAAMAASLPAAAAPRILGRA